MPAIIETKQLTKAYGSKVVLNNLNITVQPGEIVGYLGPNGAGKTTTIRLLLGLIKPTSGSALLFGQDIARSSAALHKDIAYVPGETNFWPTFTGGEVLQLLANLHGQHDAQYQADLIRKFAFEPDKKIRHYSKGNRQKICLIAALASRAPLLIFDEPTSGLDPVMAKLFRDEVHQAKQNGQTVFLSSHILDEAQELSDKIAVLRDGKMVEFGSLDELQHLASLTVEATFSGAPPDVSHLPHVSQVSIENNNLRCHVSGTMTELLTIISQAKPITLLSRKPSLEELFLDMYKSEPSASD